jgi:hypothetical protein
MFMGYAAPLCGLTTTQWPFGPFLSIAPVATSLQFTNRI